MALASGGLIDTVSDAVVTRFQLASTALTLTVNALPAVCPVGVPVLPVALPGEAVSPGASTCSLLNAPAATVIAGLVLLPTAGCVTSATVTDALPAVLSVTLDVLLPQTNAALAGSAAFGSVEVICVVSLVLTT